MGIMGAGFIKGASDAFTDRIYDVITKKANLKTKIEQETTQGDIVEQGLLQLGKKKAENIIKIAKEYVKGSGVDIGNLPEAYHFMKGSEGNATAIENTFIGIMLEASKDKNIDLNNPVDWDRVLSPNRIGLYEPSLMTNEIIADGKTTTETQYYDPRGSFDTPKTWEEADPQSWIKRTLGEPTQAGIIETEARKRGITVEDVERKRAYGALKADPKSLIESGMLTQPSLGESLAGLVQVPLASLKYMSATVPAFEDDVIKQSVEYYFSLDTPNLHNLFYKNNKPGGGYDNLTDAGKTATAQMALHISSDKFTDNIVAQENMNRILNELELPLLPGTLGDKGVDSSQLVAFLYRQGVLDQNSTVDDAVAVLKRKGSTGDKIRSDAVALLNLVKQYHESLKE